MDKDSPMTPHPAGLGQYWLAWDNEQPAEGEQFLARYTSVDLPVCVVWAGRVYLATGVATPSFSRSPVWWARLPQGEPPWSRLA